MAARGSVTIEIRQQHFPEFKEMADLRGVVVGFTVTDDKRINRQRWENIVREVEATLLEAEVLESPIGLA